MAIIFEDSAKVTKKQIPIPQNAKNVFKAMKKIYEPYLDKNIPGSKILKSLGSDKKYNKKGLISTISVFSKSTNTIYSAYAEKSYICLALCFLQFSLNRPIYSVNIILTNAKCGVSG